eukprot:2362347-Amphidinium_carterae.1
MAPGMPVHTPRTRRRLTEGPKVVQMEVVSDSVDNFSDLMSFRILGLLVWLSVNGDIAEGKCFAHSRFNQQCPTSYFNCAFSEKDENA